jgi:hypothetical protein
MVEEKINFKRIAVGFLLIGLFGVFLFEFGYTRRQRAAKKIVQDITELSALLHAIDTTCGIVKFASQKTQIDFLVAGKLVGSEISGMHLARPEKWQGPYLDANPTMQGIEYQIVHTKDGYFITPGDGVLMPNAKRVGIDVETNYSANIPLLSKINRGFGYDDMSFVSPLDINANTMNALAEFVEEDDM